MPGPAQPASPQDAEVADLGASTGQAHCQPSGRKPDPQQWRRKSAMGSVPAIPLVDSSGGLGYLHDQTDAVVLRLKALA